MPTKLLLSLALLSLLTSVSFGADDANIADDLSGFESEDDSSGNDLGFDDLDGFGDDAEQEDSITQTLKSEEAIEEPSPLSLSGNVAFKSAFGYKNHSVDGVEYQGFNQAQSALYLQADYKISKDWKVRVSGDAFYDAIYDLNNKDYNQDILDTYQTQLRLDDTYIVGSITKSLDIKIGRQIVVWGKSDSIRITDIINPLDNRLPAMTDIEDLRLPTGMLKLDYYLGSWNLSAMAIAESRIFLEAAPYGEYFPVSNIFPTAPKPFFDLERPPTSWENMQYAFAANGVFSGWDLSFYAADVYDSKWHLELVNGAPKRVVSKIKMLGTATNIALGSWLLKAEGAFISGVKYNSTLDNKNRLDLLVGADYMGFSDTVLSLEISNRHIFDYEKQMGDLTTPKPDYLDQDEMQTALRATRSFSNDTLNTTALLSMFGQSWEYGGFARVWAEIELMDALNANIGVVEYIGGDKPFIEAIKNNDRVFADITYSF